MASYDGSTSRIQLDPMFEDGSKKKKWNILLGVCAVFALVALVFIILYAVKISDDKTSVQSGQGASKGLLYYSFSFTFVL